MKKRTHLLTYPIPTRAYLPNNHVRANYIVRNIVFGHVTCNTENRNCTCTRKGSFPTHTYSPFTHPRHNRTKHIRRNRAVSFVSYALDNGTRATLLPRGKGALLYYTRTTDGKPVSETIDRRECTARRQITNAFLGHFQRDPGKPVGFIYFPLYVYVADRRDVKRKSAYINPCPVAARSNQIACLRA